MDDIRATPILLIAKETARETLRRVHLSRLAVNSGCERKARDQATLDRAMNRLARSQQYLEIQRMNENSSMRGA
jgi:hypothetical protein